MIHERFFLRVLMLLGLVLGVLILTMAMLTFVQAKGAAASIIIAKDADQTVVSGSTVTFTIAITNTGDVTLTEVIISDALASNCGRGSGDLPDLAPEEGTSYRCVLEDVRADLTNIATVTGTLQEGGGVVTGTDLAFVHVISPAIQIVKTAALTVVNVGDTVTYTIAVQNTGDSDLIDMDVEDDLTGCSLDGPDGDDGDHVLELDETWVYTCPVMAGSEDIINTSVVTATTEAGGTVTDWDQAEVDVIHPGIEIAKTAALTVVHVGDTVNYTISVENTGDSGLTNVTVDDDLATCTLSGPDGDAQNPGVLDLDEVWEYTCSVSAGDDDIVNTAVVSATDVAGGVVSDWAQAEVSVIHPAIEIAKTPDVQTVARNSSVTFTISVTNTGDVSLAAVSVSDARVHNCNANLGALDVDESASYECTRVDVTHGFINSAIATGTSETVGKDVTDADVAKVRLDETQACPADMVAYWRLDETGGDITYDDYYYGHDGTCSGRCPTPVTGYVNGGQEFNGSDTGIGVPAVPGDDSFNWGAHDSFSIEFWMKADSPSCAVSNEVIVGRDDGSNSELHWWVGIRCWAGGKAAFVLEDRDGGIGSVAGTTAVTDGSWYHIVAVRDGSVDENRIYVNGVEEASEEMSYTAGFDSPTAALNIGYLANGFHFNGILDEVALYDRALSSDEIRQHYNEGLGGVWYCRPGAFAPIIVSTPVTEATTGRPYVYDVEAVGNPVPTYTLVTKPSGMTIDSATGLISWIPTVAQEGSHDVEVEASNQEGAFSQPFTILVHEGTICPADMVAYWKLDEIGDATYYDFFDGHDGTCSGRCPTPVTGYVNGGQEFNGSDTGIGVPAVPGDDSFNWGAHDSFSIEFWMKAGSPSCAVSNEVIVGRDDGSNSELHWWVGIRCWAGGKAAFVLEDRDGGIGSVAGTTAVTDGSWYHIVAVRDGSVDENRIYVNGVEEASEEMSYTAGFDSPTAALNIGYLANGFHFNGILDEVALYDRALSSDEIRQHYNEGLGGPGYCISPDIAVAKTASPMVVYNEGMVTYTYTVTNPGDTPLSDVTLRDDKCSAVTLPAGDDGDGRLDPTETWIYQCPMTLNADITNTVTVTGSPSLGGAVRETDTVVVDVIRPEIGIDKTAIATAVYAGDIVTYTYTVTNLGDDPLLLVRVSDDKCISVTLVAGDSYGSYKLDPGEIWTYACSTVLITPTTNTATVTGTDSAGGPVSAMDTAFVDICSHQIFLPTILKE